MVFCIRKALSVASPRQSDAVYGSVFKNVSVPIELGLPFDFSQFQSVSIWIPKIVAHILDNRVSCVSIHAPEGTIAALYKESFLSWASIVTNLADQVNAQVVVFHPVRSTSINHSASMNLLLTNILALQEKTRSIVALETFNGGQYLGYQGILDVGLPICMDTSHMSYADALKLAERYHEKIAHIHLSKRSRGLTHRPAGRDALELLTRLAKLGWDGSVCFEYLDTYTEEMEKDLETFRSLFS